MTSVLLKKYTCIVLFIACILCLSLFTNAQKTTTDSFRLPADPFDTIKNSLLLPDYIQDTNRNGGEYLTLRQCIDYALQHQPGLNRSLININITRTTNAISLSQLLPQVSATGNFTHYFQLPNSSVTVNSAGRQTANTFIPELSLSQNIFNPALLYAKRSAPLYVKEAEQARDSTKIFIVSSVSKAFYNVLLTLEQINVLKEDTARLGKNLRDAYYQYKGGIVDETDYEEASITLNNSQAQLNQAKQNVVPQYAALKQLMGFPPENQFNVNFDTTEMMQGINIDTTEQLQYEKRIEYQQFKTLQDLQSQEIRYYRFAYLPTISAFSNYNLYFQNSRFKDLVSAAYPSFLAGLSLSVPIFTGFSRLHYLQRAKLQQRLYDWDVVDLRLQINSEYTAALADYKSNLYNLRSLQKNVALARRVYFVVNLQYKQGIVPYLNVITAESNLITSEINYLNALFQVLSSKIDLQKAMGNISY